LPAFHSFLAMQSHVNRTEETHHSPGCAAHPIPIPFWNAVHFTQNLLLVEIEVVISNVILFIHLIIGSVLTVYLYY